MYDEFKTQDLDTLKIIQNDKKFGSIFGGNVQILEILLAKKDINLQAQDLQKIAGIFEGLERIKENSQLSKS
ncbi:hypothetical protein CIG2463D_1635 [Campylobacter iguaniorum]|uniref:Uncharacterized protein n=1 Tax=Campylobacter iguaniorum TaxID=1244531 RepID=A0A076FAL9_9BACT|nr:hypothetical protein [Campylobacter iguaniorum]AII15265.1 hypothetical protein CIG1485E_1442 [Campylobacter iguaniorum]ALV25191.1 hypothetical protein CIG2463D_1635 [Campylobacter iguaniorum]